MLLLKPLSVLLSCSLVLYGGLCAWLYWGQRRLIFLPSQMIESTPQDYGIPYEDVWIPVGDGEGLVHGWWLPGPEESALTFLYLHGNAENISQNLTWAAAIQALGASVLMIDYRGYGRSSGPFPSEAQLYDDALAAWHYLHHQRGIAPQDLVIYGHSLGGAVGVQLATQIPQAAGLIVDSSFTSMAAMAARSGYANWFPVQQLLTQRFDSLARVPSLAMPVLYIHGTEDGSVPTTMGQQLYGATPEPKALWLVPGAGHNDVIEQSGPEFQRRIEQFLGDYVLIQR
jgi:pimeloyl-ACP methyl ester carboxylesterase